MGKIIKLYRKYKLYRAVKIFNRCVNKLWNVVLNLMGKVMEYENEKELNKERVIEIGKEIEKSINKFAMEIDVESPHIFNRTKNLVDCKISVLEKSREEGILILQNKRVFLVRVEEVVEGILKVINESTKDIVSFNHSVEIFSTFNKELSKSINYIDLNLANLSPSNH